MGDGTNQGIPTEMAWCLLNADGSLFSRTHLVVRPAVAEVTVPPSREDAVLLVAQSIGVDWKVTTAFAHAPEEPSGRKYVTRGVEMEPAWVSLIDHSRDVLEVASGE
jgi:hypothetical protein